MPRIPEVGDVGRLPPIAELVGLQEEESIENLAARLGFTKIANPWDERDAHLFKRPISSLNANAEVDPLAKNAGAGRARRIESLKAWIRSEKAMGRSVDELIAHAEMHDVETANEIREAALGL
jgi:hypothetical protein